MQEWRFEAFILLEKQAAEPRKRLWFARYSSATNGLSRRYYYYGNLEISDRVQADVGLISKNCRLITDLL